MTTLSQSSISDNVIMKRKLIIIIINFILDIIMLII